MEREKLVGLVTAGQRGDSEALNQLFNAFYNDVYYFALKTVKDEDLACDITQDTFIKVIESLDGLREPAAFVTWMKQIAYNECCRYFKKKKDLLVDEDEDGNSIFDTLVEDRTEFIPDEALDQEEFRKTILAMLDQLSPEQRSAVLLYYHDEIPVKQIAEIQGVSEGTVKSRLNYARKALKTSVEDYEKKNNIKLHSFAFFPLLVWLLASSEEAMPAGAAAKVAEAVSAATNTTISVSGGSAAAAAATATTAAGAGSAAAAIPLAAKIAAVVIAAAVIIGGVSTVVNQAEPVPATTPTVAATVPSTAPAAEETTEQETEPALSFVPVADEDFPTLLQGGLTKEQLAIFLGYAPGDYSGMALSAQAVRNLVNGIVTFPDVMPIEVGTNENWECVCSVEELNRILSVLTNCRISEETHPDEVDGDSYVFSPVGGMNRISATITSAEHNGVEMRIAYTYRFDGLIPEDGYEQEDYIVILKVNANGLYQITEIGRAEDMALMEQMLPDDSPAWKRACMHLLLDFPRMHLEIDGLRVSQDRSMNYCLADMTGSGIPELILVASSSEEGENILSFRCPWVGIYTFDGGEPQRLFAGAYIMPGFAWDESNKSLIVSSLDFFNGRSTYYALTIGNGTVEENMIFEGIFNDVEEEIAYDAEHGYVSLPSAEIDDFSLLINN